MFIDIPEKLLPVNIEIDNHPIQLFYREQVRDFSDNKQGGQTAVRINTNGRQAQASVPNTGASKKISNSGNNEFEGRDLEDGEIIEDENDVGKDTQLEQNFKNNKGSLNNDSQTQCKEVSIDLTVQTTPIPKCPVSPRKDDLQKQS